VETEGSQLAAHGLLLSALAVVLLGAGCGSSTPEPEAPPVEAPPVVAPAAPPVDSEAPPVEQSSSKSPKVVVGERAEAPPVEQHLSAGSIRNLNASAADVAAALRTYLAQHFLYASWYPSVGRIEVSRGRAIVSSWHLDRSAVATAERICVALLSSRRVAKATVKRGKEGIVACP
jgi:hypothetical protein